jgi:hypothetical protein
MNSDRSTKFRVWVNHNSFPSFTFCTQMRTHIGGWVDGTHRKMLRWHLLPLPLGPSEHPLLRRGRYDTAPFPGRSTRNDVSQGAKWMDASPHAIPTSSSSSRNGRRLAIGITSTLPARTTTTTSMLNGGACGTWFKACSSGEHRHRVRIWLPDFLVYFLYFLNMIKSMLLF